MAGLVDCESVWPYGYQGPWRKVAKNITPSISPGLYDLKQLQTSYRAHVPVPHLGDRWPAPNQGDTWGNVNARYSTPQAPDVDSYDPQQLELGSTLKVPVPMPRAPGSLFAELAKLTGGTPPGAEPEPSKDILEIGKLILKTTTDRVKRHFWQTHINGLTKLRMIAIERPSGLNGDESKLEKLISDAMKAEAIDISGVNLTPLTITPPVSPHGTPLLIPVITPPTTPKVRTGVVKNTDFGLGNTDIADVKLDPDENKKSLKKLLKNKYSGKKVEDVDIDTWHDALVWFDDLIPEYVNPPKKKGYFTKYIMDAIDRAGPISDVFAAYLVRSDKAGALTEYWLNRYITTPSALYKIAEASVGGKFLYHPNFRVA